MDLKSNTEKSLDELRNLPKQSRSSLLRQSILKILDAVVYFLGLSKSAIYSILFRDGCNYRSRCKKCSQEFRFASRDKMNFRALKRRLNLFEKRDKKKNKPKYAVYVLESPPTLSSKGGQIPAVVLQNTKEIAEIFPEPEENLSSRHTVTVDVHKELNGKHAEFKVREKGMGDFLNKHILKPGTEQPLLEKESNPVENVIEETQEFRSKGQPYPFSKIRDDRILGGSSERHQLENDSNPMLHNSGSSITPNCENCACDIVNQSSEPAFTRDASDNDNKVPNSEKSQGHVLFEMSNDNKFNCFDRQPSLEMGTLDYNIADTYNEIVATAFQHAIIPEKMQQEGTNLAKSIHNCYEEALEQQRENMELTDTIPNMSPVIENLKSRQEAGRDNILKKYPIYDLAKEAAYIVRECEQMDNAVSFYIKTTTNCCDKDSLKDLTALSVLVNSRIDASLKFLRRLREYVTHKEKLSSIVVFRYAVEKTLNASIRKVIHCVKTLKFAAETTDKRIQALKSSEKRHDKDKTVDPSMLTHKPAPSSSSVDERVADKSENDTHVQTNATKATANVEDTKTEKATELKTGLKPKEMVKTKTIADGNTQDVKKDTSTKKTLLQTRTENSTSTSTSNTNNKKSWKTNRVTDLRCAPPVASLSGHRIIAPIDECSPRNSIHSTESNLIPKNIKHTGASVEGDRSEILKEETEGLAKQTQITDPETKAQSNDSMSGSKTLNSCKNAPPRSVAEYFRKDEARGQRVDLKRKERGDEGVVHESLKRQEHNLPTATSGEGDGNHKVPDKVTNIKTPNTSTPKKSAVYKEAREPQGSNRISNRSTRRQLLAEKEVVPRVGTEFTADDEVVVHAFFDLGVDCIESVVVDEVVINQAVAIPEHKALPLDDNLALYAKIADDNASMLREAFSKPLDGNKSLNSTFDTSYDSNQTGNDTRNLSDMSRSFTSYIETNNTIDFSSLEVKPGHGDRPNKKKIEAEIKPKKKKTRGTPNQHLDGKMSTKVKVKPHFSNGDGDKDKNFDSKEGSGKDSITGEKKMATQTVSKSWTENEINRADKKCINPKPMHYEQWQTIDQREVDMVPDRVHYRNESKLKDVEEMYSVSSGKNKKKKKRKDKKGKSTNKDRKKGESDDDEWFIE